MKSEEEISNIVDRCLDIFNEQKCTPVEVYAIIGVIQASTHILVNREVAVFKEKVKVKVE